MVYKVHKQRNHLHLKFFTTALGNRKEIDGFKSYPLSKSYVLCILLGFDFLKPIALKIKGCVYLADTLLYNF